MVWSQTPRSDPNHIDIGEKSVVEGGSGRWFSWLKQGARSRRFSTSLKTTGQTPKSLIDSEILKSEGVLNLVSSNESHLLDLTLAEKLDDLNRVAAVVSRLGKKCSETALQGFQHN
uniref:DUF3475 domain-containing protein n=1 Tax=Fagus sylvatica TaxID=28930 RepID=A0A2N9HLE7_FAGSY